MTLPKLSPQNAQAALEYLFESGKLNESDLQLAIAGGLTEETKRIVSLVHGLLCCSEHDQKTCQFYLEEVFDNCWTEHFHKKWSAETVKLLIRLQLGTEAELLSLLAAIKKPLQVLAELEELSPAALELLVLVKGWKNL